MVDTIVVENSTVNIIAGHQFNFLHCDGLRAQFLHWLQRLAKLDYLSKHTSACDQYVKGTCQWFIGDKRFANWVDGKTKTLICLGCRACLFSAKLFCAYHLSIAQLVQGRL
jgi:hypothetical protein